MAKDLYIPVKLKGGKTKIEAELGQTVKIGPVKSVNGKTGDVKLTAQDVNALPEGSLEGYAT